MKWNVLYIFALSLSSFAKCLGYSHLSISNLIMLLYIFRIFMKYSSDSFTLLYKNLMIFFSKLNTITLPCNHDNRTPWKNPNLSFHNHYIHPSTLDKPNWVFQTSLFILSSYFSHIPPCHAENLRLHKNNTHYTKCS